MKTEKEKTAVTQLEAQTESTADQVVEAEGKGKRILNAVVNTLLVVAIALAAICTYVSYVSTSGNGVPSIFGIRLFSIQTESMYPTLLPGDLIFDVGVKDAGELRRDDIITYWTVINGERVLNTHRVHEVFDGGGYLIFATKGDNNTAADALTVHESEIVGKYAFRVAGVGKVFDYLQTSTGFLIVVVIPVFLFFLFHLVQFFRVLFEYQNVKNRIKYEKERGRTEDLIAAHQRMQNDAQAQARAQMEAELRERLRAEIMATMAAQQAPQNAPAAEPVKAESEKEEVPAAQEAPKQEEALATQEEPKQEETPAAQEEPKQEETPAAEAETAAMDEVAIEALIAKQREAIEAQLREKLRAEMLSAKKQSADAEQTAQEKTEDAQNS